jgi:signal transduction histidine kinase
MKKISRDSSQDPLEDTSLNLLIEDARDFMAEKFKSREIDFIVNLPREDVIVSCRTVEISQVLLNLLNNSFQAIDDKGWVRIDVIIEPRIRIIITDSGPGIASELQDKIFQPFFTTKDVGLGTGLGLSISRKMIEGHNGTLRLNPEAKNTQFIIEL